eukprot:CAMPEP_0171162524 /NCGR_PEP_ID=MMETSP0790-20130122/4635_1 /TAXON_ID=2925 /ORGANISM="Alexandrium catenella, Strain OF101" /LENGTH=369 /DNA_ID=CAMNT_0011627127 /DNA_START=128 /DNA_END=1237 /DNA_ORIENTATION=-
MHVNVNRRALDKSNVHPFEMPEKAIAHPTKEELRAAVSKMQQEPMNREAQLRGCGAVGWRSGQDTRKHWILDTGALEAIVAAMRAFPRDKQLQLRCAGSISGTCLFNRPLSLRAGELGAVELVVDIMRRWPEDPDCQVGGMSGGFMDFSGENRARWAGCGGVEANLDSIRRFYRDPKVVLQAMFAFSSGTEDNDARVAKGGGLELFLDLLRDHAHSYRVPEETFQAIKFVRTPELQSRMIELGFPARIVEVMRVNSDDRFMQDPACVSLMSFVYNATQRAIFAKSGVAEVAFDAVFDFGHHQGVAQDNEHAMYDGYRPDQTCMKVLASMAEEPEGKKRLVQLGARERLGDLLKTHPEEGRARKMLADLS